MPRLRLRVRDIVPGRCSGEALVVPGRLSFYGEVDAETGLVRGLGESLSGRVLFIRGMRGSTVGPYVLYALSRRGRGPRCIVAGEAEPMLVAAAVIAETPLLLLLDSYDLLEPFYGRVVAVEHVVGEGVVVVGV